MMPQKYLIMVMIVLVLLMGGINILYVEYRLSDVSLYPNITKNNLTPKTTNLRDRDWYKDGSQSSFLQKNSQESSDTDSFDQLKDQLKEQFQQRFIFDKRNAQVDRKVVLSNTRYINGVKVSYTFTIKGEQLDGTIETSEVDALKQIKTKLLDLDVQVLTTTDQSFEFVGEGQKLISNVLNIFGIETY